MIHFGLGRVFLYLMRLALTFIEHSFSYRKMFYDCKTVSL